MIKSKQLSIALLAFIGLWSGVLQAQTWQIEQNVKTEAFAYCNISPSPNFHTSLETSKIFEVQIAVSHNIIELVGSDLVAQISSQGSRTVYFDIYSNGVLEGSIARSDPWLRYAEFSNGSSNTSYSITAADLETAGITTSGDRSIDIRVEYSFSGPSAQDIDLEVQLNGVVTCTQSDFHLPGQNFLNCDFQTLYCFEYAACDGTLTMNVQIIPDFTIENGILIFIWTHKYTASMAGGSGDFSFYWEVSEDPTLYWPLATTEISISLPDRSFPTVILTVVDNVTGCEYKFPATNKQVEQLIEEHPGKLIVGPNPAVSGSDINLHFGLAKAGDVQVTMYALDGKQVLGIGGTFPGETGANQMKVSTTGLERGLYLMRIQLQGGGVLTQKIELR